jgi:ankyrin repeat protein
MTSWAEALKKKDLRQIKQCLNEGYVPKDLQASVVIKDGYGKEKSLSLVAALLETNNLASDATCFETATQLLKNGAKMPKSRKTPNDFESASKYLYHLAQSPDDLFLALYNNPNIVNQQGEDRRTVVHHAARLTGGMGSHYGCLIYSQLLASPLVNFNLPDNEGNTPIHLVATDCADRPSRWKVFLAYVTAAAQKKCDFNALNKQGLAAIHIAADTADDDEWDPVATLLKKAPDINVNLLSSSGKTAFFYAVRNLQFLAAHTLLNAGADPTLGTKEQGSFNLIKHYKAHGFLSIELAQMHIDQLDRLEQRMLSVVASMPKKKGHQPSFWAKKNGQKDTYTTPTLSSHDDG